MKQGEEQGELVRLIRLRPLPGDVIVIEAGESEREALARRFGLPSVQILHAEVTLERDGSSVIARGTMKAQIVQTCAISGEEFAVSINEPVLLRFIEAKPVARRDDEEEFEIELSDEDCDEIEFSGDAIDLGEAIAQTLGLAIDPYAQGPDADITRQAAGISGDDEPSGPLAQALRALKRD